MIYLTNVMKWHTLRSQMNVIINANSQQYAEMEFETLHANDNRLCGAAFTVNVRKVCNLHVCK